MTDPYTTMLDTAANLDLDEEDDWALVIREQELHKLTAIHTTLARIQAAIEDEFDYRIESEDKIASGTDEDRAYAEEHRSPTY